MTSPLTDRFNRRDRNALSRLVTLFASGGAADELLRDLTPPAKPTRVVALTGPGGVGKSSLTGKLVSEIRAKSLTVAVLACDPESPLTGGALLGDRFRMPAAPDDGVFIRSLAAAGGQGALARHLPAVLRLLACWGFDVVLLETVGAGQGDTAVRELADVLVLLLQPETGDDLQWEKAGLLEVADVVVIHKADLPGADRAEAQVISSLALTPGARVPPVIRVSSNKGTGVAELWSAVEGVASRKGGGEGDEFWRAVAARLEARWATVNDADAMRELARAWRAGELGIEEAVEVVLGKLGEHGRRVKEGPWDGEVYESQARP